MFTNGTFLPA